MNTISRPLPEKKGSNRVQPFNPTLAHAAKRCVAHLRSVLPPTVEVKLVGSLPLRIAGRGDIDIDVLTDQDQYPSCQPVLEEEFGPPTEQDASSVGWHVTWKGNHLDLWLTSPTNPQASRQLAFQEVLLENSRLRREYEKVKMAAAELPEGEYKKQKELFWQQVVPLVNQ